MRQLIKWHDIIKPTYPERGISLEKSSKQQYKLQKKNGF